MNASTEYFYHRSNAEIWPDTLNIEDMAQMSQNFLNNSVDFNDNNRPYFYCFYGKEPPELCHNVWDHCEDLGRFLYASIFSRIILGEEKEPQIEKQWKDLIYASIIDGEQFSCRPIPDPYNPFRDKAAEETLDMAPKENQSYEIDLWDNRSVFTGLYLSYLITGDKKAGEYARNMINRLKEISIIKGNWAYLSRYQYPGKYIPGAEEQPVPGQNMLGWITPLVFAYKQSGDCSLLELARGYCQCVIDMLPDSLRDFPDCNKLGFNVHAFLYGLAGIVRCGRELWSPKFIVWAKRHFDEIIEDLGSSIGWIAEQFPSSKLGKVEQSCESCCVADAIDTAIQLAKSGYPEYWALAERYMKNYLSEAQLKDTSWISGVGGGEYDFESTSINIPERIIGAYVGWGAPNDFVDPNARRYRALQNCCGPHGAFGAFAIWDNIISYEHFNATTCKSGLYVNMHFNRETKFAKVEDYSPYEGCIKITLYKDNDVSVRIPEGIEKEQITVFIDGKAREFEYCHPFIYVNDIKIGECITMQYPIIEKSTTENINKKLYAIKWRGNIAVHIDPEGEVMPLFIRDEKITDATPVKFISYNRSDKSLNW